MKEGEGRAGEILTWRSLDMDFAVSAMIGVRRAPVRCSSSLIRRVVSYPKYCVKIESV
jgi:hypothetical protein